MEQGETAPGPRVAAIDVARGAALIGMALYHLSWDFAYFRLAPAEFPLIPPMRLFSHTVAGAFLTLAGVSLALAHRGGLRWRAFLRRLGVIGGAAALLTLATYLYAPQQTILFGILHCIAVSSLLAAPLLRLPAWVALVLSALVIAAPWLIASPAFDSPPLVWLGLGTAPPQTLDWRPLAPWSGLVWPGPPCRSARPDGRRPWSAVPMGQYLHSAGLEPCSGSEPSPIFVKPAGCCGPAKA